MMDLAFFRLPDGRAWVGLGPFRELENPPDEPCFYVNDFDLSASHPWKVPSQLLEITELAQLEEFLSEDAIPEITWQRPVNDWFKMAFRRIRRDVIASKIQKMVPVVTEQGARQSGDLSGLLRQVYSAPQGLWGYGWIQANAGFLGATPELLFNLQGQGLDTMALAGTSKPNESVGFEIDKKEIEEHELVVDFILDTLRPLADVSRQPRQITPAAGLQHFRTLIHAELKEETALATLIHALHPTPAVGALPRNEENLSRLSEYRLQMETPGHFGAPFGFKCDGTFHAVVAIRGLSWNGNKVYLPSGCGIVAGSAFDHEWRELRIKRESVAQLLNIETF